MNNKINKLALASVMLCFFAMGFVDLVGIASNFVKKDLGLNDATANIFPSLVFFWFLIFSVPTGVLMNKIGRKKTVLLSLIVTVVSLLLPLFGESFGLMLVSFSLLGIGNALMQTSLNPLVATVVRGGHLASTLTSPVTPTASMPARMFSSTSTITNASSTIPSRMPKIQSKTVPIGGHSIYMIIGIAASLFQLSTPIEEEGPAFAGETSPTVGKQFAACFRLLGKPIVLLSFVGIMCHVGIDVGTNTTAPKILIERLGMTLNDAAFATSLYFIFRTLGCLTGSFFLRVVNNRLFFVISITMMALSMCGLFFGTTKLVLYIAIALVGYGNSNVFSLVFAQALQSVPDKQNEVSGLMIMGLFGGTVFPLLMGFASDAMGQAGAVLVMAVGIAYLFTYIKNVK